MNEQENLASGTHLTATQESQCLLWEKHVECEFATHNTEDTLATMVEDAYVNHIPVLTGGVGKDALQEFYSQRFIPKMPPDADILPVVGIESARKVLDPRLPSNALIDRADQSKLIFS